MPFIGKFDSSSIDITSFTYFVTIYGLDKHLKGVYNFTSIMEVREVKVLVRY